jgi:hypothetical protein
VTTYVPLRKGTHAHCDECALAVSGSFDQRCPFGLSGLALHLDGARNLGHFELDQGVRCIASSMESSEQFFGFFLFSIGNQPSNSQLVREG